MHRILKTFIIVIIVCAFSSTTLAQVTGSSQQTNTDSAVTGSSQYTSTSGGVPTLSNPLKNVNSLGDIINVGVEAFTYLAVLGAVLVLIWIGLKFVMARGNPQKISEASRWLGYAVIGIAIIIGARLIISVVLSTLKSTGIVKPEIVNSANNALDGK